MKKYGNHRVYSEHKVELLAPAGNAEGFYGAVHAGADAVYLAGNRFGARAYAENFTEEKLLECIRYAHLMGRKIYLTVNTLLKEQEIQELYDYLCPLYEAGLDAVIVQDMGVLRLVRECFPGLHIHASTQMTLCGRDGISLLRTMGADRVVPARELSLEEIGEIKRRVSGQSGSGNRVFAESDGREPKFPEAGFMEAGSVEPRFMEPGFMEIECFIHGAMCYCYSGQCLFSSLLGGRSGNRGRCAQPCRLPYTVDTTNGQKKSGYLLSLKDMCTIDHIPELIEAGIDSLKIEGRMKKPEYAAGVTSVYRRYIDKYYELREKRGAREAAGLYRVEKEDRRILESLYIRTGVQNGYYFRRSGREMITIDNPSYNGGQAACKRQDREGRSLCENASTLSEEIYKTYVEKTRKLPVRIKAEFQEGKRGELVMECRLPDGAGTDSRSAVLVCGRAKGDVVGNAQKQPLSKESVEARLGRLGDSAFYGESMEISLGQNCFYPLGRMNQLRRDAVADLERQILAVRGYENCRQGKKPQPEIFASSEGFQKSGIREKGYVLSVRTLEQLEAVKEWIEERQDCGILRLYVDGDLLVGSGEETVSLCAGIEACLQECRIFAALPYIVRETDREYLNEIFAKTEKSRLFGGYLARSMDGLGFVLERVRHCGEPETTAFAREERKVCEKRRIACRTDAGVYVWNRMAAAELTALADGFCLPYELKEREQRELLKGFSWEKIVYGRIPLMLTANCLRKTTEGCRKSRKEASVMTLKDRYHKSFPVAVNCLQCMNIIYNSIPFSLYKELSKWKGDADLRMDFTVESASEVKQLLCAFILGQPLPEGEYTSGYERRGVE